MKKIFTLIAMALVAAGANAQDWKATADAPAAGSNLVTTSSVTISTVNETTAAHIQNPETSTNMEPSEKKPVQRKEAKIGRNDPCPCGSGKKYKQCCGK